MRIPVDILPVFKSPAVQVLTFYGGMPADGMEKNITNRMERGTGRPTASRGRSRGRSSASASSATYFQPGIDPNGALTEEISLAAWEYPTMPPGTLPPVVLPFDPTSTMPVCLVALDSKNGAGVDALRRGRYEVRNMIMSKPGAIAPVVYGGKIRAVMLYLDRKKMQARHLRRST